MKKTTRRERIRQYNKRSPKDLLYLFIFILIGAGIAKSAFAADNPSFTLEDNPIRTFYAKTFAQTTLVSPIVGTPIVIPEATKAPTPTPTPIPTNPFAKESPKGIAWEINKERFGVENWEAWETLGNNESGWNPFSVNPSSGACGIPQALPCSKMGCENWDYKCQVEWMAGYIEDRYTNPNGALKHWMSREPVFINGQYKDLGNWY